MKFYCECDQKLSAPEETAGRRGHCPACKKTFHVPTRAEAEAQRRARAQRPMSLAERARREPGAVLKWYCECGQKLGVPKSEAGQRGRCPRCHRSFRVPDPEAMRRKAEQRAGSARAASSPEPPAPTPPPVTSGKSVLRPRAAPAAREPEELVEAEPGAETEEMSTPAAPSPPSAPGAPPRT